MRPHDNRGGLVVCHMQARVNRPYATAVLVRQRGLLVPFCRDHGIRADWWHIRTKGAVPHPTLEDRIRAGEVYAVIATGWAKLQECRRSPGWSVY
ncbi:MAG: hypothetical protein RDU89_06795 [bacterium]|nr:hypothetical protein [bacterium]